MPASRIDHGAPDMSDSISMPPLGATPLPNHGWRFAVWAPRTQKLDLRMVQPESSVPMKKIESGYFETEINNASD
ncbi:MAG TPA: hypothetical protein VIM00_05245, partial [Candidatus Acidoferrum sp.]